MTTTRPRAGLPRFPQLTVLGWFRAVFAVLAILVVAAALIIFEVLASNSRVSAELEGRILPARAQAYRLQGALVDQETGVRGFALTRNPAFLQPYTKGLAAEASAAAQLRTLLSRKQRLSADLSGLERAADSWRRFYALPLIALARRGPLTSKDTSLLAASKHSFDRLRTFFAAQNADLQAEARRESASLSRTRTITDVSFTLSLLAFLLAAAALTVVLHNAVVRPLRQLRADSRRVVSGDFGHRIEPAGPADLRAVAAEVEEMRSELVGALDAARAAQELTARQASDLDAQAAELLRSNSELEQFAYVASHDLQEPLRKVASFCQLLEKRYGGQLDERGRQYIGFAVDGAKRMQVLISDLLTFSRVGRSGDDRFRVRLPLDVTLDSALAAVAAAIEESGAVIERPDRLPEVLGDATLLAMLWQNLLSNGMKFRAPGRAPVLRITAMAQAGSRMWQFCVEDNGIGIPPEFAGKIFVIFQRLHGRDAYPGTGIGLALCKRIVEHHGGEIGLDDTYAGGARICFTLPRIDPARPEQAGQEPGIRAGGTSAEGVPA
ncbi:MAG TPA: CHASE3 domain-containing protein [Streptosporangiaceae bacterium]|nr:CHASE3 domain-containing protein [Streptosporangiaceae bacterium]